MTRRLELLLAVGLAGVGCDNGSDRVPCGQLYTVEGRPLDQAAGCLEEPQVADCSSEPCGDGAITYARDDAGGLWQLSAACIPSAWTEEPSSEVPAWVGCDETTERHPASFSCDGGQERFVLDAECVFVRDPLGTPAESLGVTFTFPPHASGAPQGVTIARGNLSFGPVETQYSGSMDFLGGSTRVTDWVSVHFDSCSANTTYSPEPCTIEILELERGEVTSMEDGEQEKAVELGSRVRVSVVCPEEGLYSAGADDYGPSRWAFSPHEFVVELTDCEVD